MVSSWDRTSTNPGWLAAGEVGAASGALELAIAWSLSEPERVGELARLPARGVRVLGRGAARPDDGAERLLFAKRRPGSTNTETSLASPGISRRQLVVRAENGELRFQRVGRVATWLDGRRVDEGVLEEGSRLLLEGQLLLFATRRGGAEGARSSAPSFDFGRPDDDGIVGESAAAWFLRDEIAFYAARAGHVLIVGPSGSGKELAARAMHRGGARAGGPYIARSAPTLPEGLIDAELFGNVRGYPNPGMRERPGLVGEADGGTLFLDEIGELSESMQSHLLRVLDGGEYHRLGDPKTRRANLRVIGATNRAEDELKPDLLARFPLRIRVPGLDERRSDVPILARAILRRLALTDGAIRERFFEGDEPRIDPAVIEALLAHGWSAHARELESLLVQCMSGSRGSFLTLTSAARERLRTTTPKTLSVEEIRAALDQAGGNVSKAWRELGLSSRDALNRLLKKHGIATRRTP